MIELFQHIIKLDFPWLFSTYGTAIYVILFLVIFIETGVVAMPFLPGDSLIFTATIFAAQGYLNLWLLLTLLISAAIIGDNCNYWIGRKFGIKIFNIKFKNKPIVKYEYLTKTQDFFQTYGTKAIIMARFVPFLRTFAPFAAGLGKMHYPKYFIFDVLGGFVWVGSLAIAGWLLGEVSFVKNHIDLVCIGIVLISLAPVIFSFFKRKKV